MSTDTSWTRRAFQPCNKGAYMNDKRVFLTKHSPEYWRVTLNNPPVNIFGPKTIPQLNEVITAIETDEQLKVVVFDSAIDGFFMTHYDFLAKVEETTSLPPGPTYRAEAANLLVPAADWLSRLRQSADGQPASEVNSPWPATCVLPAVKKRSCRTSKSALVWCQEVDLWHG